MTRIVSLLPSATEIVCQLGARSQLVGVSHECDHPAGVIGLPVLTCARCLSASDSAAIDRSVNEVLQDALAVYQIDVDKLRELDPDVIVTQNLCEVCAVSLKDVQAAVACLIRPDVHVVSLSPLRLGDILGDIWRVASALQRGAIAERVVAALNERIERVREVTRSIGERPRVLTIEWLDPIMPGGTWMPELIDLAGGVALATSPGEKTRPLDAAALHALDPQVVVIKPCGFDLRRTCAELPLLKRLPTARWSAFRDGRVYIADGNAYFNRPGPRIVDSLEILAALLHPAHFPGFARRYQDATLRVTADLGVEPAFR